MWEMKDVWPRWYRAVDLLLDVDSTLGQVGGAAEQSAEFTRLLDAFRADAERVLNTANASVRALEGELRR